MDQLFLRAAEIFEAWYKICLAISISHSGQNLSGKKDAKKLVFIARMKVNEMFYLRRKKNKQVYVRT